MLCFNDLQRQFMGRWKGARATSRPEHDLATVEPFDSFGWPKASVPAPLGVLVLQTSSIAATEPTFKEGEAGPRRSAPWNETHGARFPRAA
ncbi:MAG: hypothetical protein HW378_4650, partial [Anaerolineales bacterium]|nr:hypothetical protein [Anaerolineales bacterium]